MAGSRLKDFTVHGASVIIRLICLNILGNMFAARTENQSGEKYKYSYFKFIHFNMLLFYYKKVTTNFVQTW